MLDLLPIDLAYPRKYVSVGYVNTVVGRMYTPDRVL
jgi:hypothetical protein